MAKKKNKAKQKMKPGMRKPSSLRKLLILLVIGYGLYFLWEIDPPGPNPQDITTLPPVTAAPLQKKLSLPLPYEHRGFELMPVASYVMTARLLSVHHYEDDQFARVSPYDVVVAWGKLADPRFAGAMKIEQQSRYYNIHKSPTLLANIDEKEIPHLMANMHLIPADNAVQTLMERLQPGMQVTLIGYLVNARREKMRMRTSTTRNDGGPGGSEVMLVQRIVIN